MDVTSLGLRTDLALLELGGTRVEDRGSHLVVRTPHNPEFHWGNFLLLPSSPADGEVTRWIERFRTEFPAAEHVALGVDVHPGTEDALEPLRTAGMQVEIVHSMTTTQVLDPPHPQPDVALRPLDTDEDWHAQSGLYLMGEEDRHVTPEFAALRTRSLRDLTRAGHGTWWGGFAEGRLVASLGIFRAGPGLARFQEVKTHPEFRRRGLAGWLVHRASRHAFHELGATRLVMVADPDAAAIRVYRSVGFDDGSPHVEATLLPVTS